MIALAAGMCEGLDLGTNAMAALVTRGCYEMRRIGLSMGGKSETFMGLSGVGDTFGTCFGPLSRNRNLGVRLGRGERLKDILSEQDEVAEGVDTALALARLIRRSDRSYRMDLKVRAARARLSTPLHDGDAPPLLLATAPPGPTHPASHDARLAANRPSAVPDPFRRRRRARGPRHAARGPAQPDAHAAHRGDVRDDEHVGDRGARACARATPTLDGGTPLSRRANAQALSTFPVQADELDDLDDYEPIAPSRKTPEPEPEPAPAGSEL